MSEQRGAGPSKGGSVWPVFLLFSSVAPSMGSSYFPVAFSAYVLVFCPCHAENMLPERS